MFYRVPAAEPSGRVSRLKKLALLVLALAGLSLCARAQTPAAGFERELDASGPVELRVKNRTGRVTVVAEDDLKQVSIRATSAAGLGVGEKDVRVTHAGGSVQIEVEREGAAARPDDGRKVVASPAQIERERIDLLVRVPSRSRVWVETEAGAVDVVGNLAEAEAKTDTGTIRADVPLDDLRYSFRWTLSRPRFFSEVELPEAKHKRGGFFEIAGRFPVEKEKQKGKKNQPGESAEEVSEEVFPPETSPPAAAEVKPTPADKKAARAQAEAAKKEEERKREEAKKKEEAARAEAKRKSAAEKAEAKKSAADLRVRLSLETARGVVLFGVKDESRVPSDLRERTLTEAARAIIRSGDTELIDAIRKVAPRLVGDYAETLGRRARRAHARVARRQPLRRARVGRRLPRARAGARHRPRGARHLGAHGE